MLPTLALSKAFHGRWVRSIRLCVRTENEEQAFNGAGALGVCAQVCDNASFGEAERAFGLPLPAVFPFGEVAAHLPPVDTAWLGVRVPATVRLFRESADLRDNADGALRRRRLRRPYDVESGYGPPLLPPARN